MKDLTVFGVESIVHPQEYFSKLSERTVAYINVDISVFGTGWCFSSFNIFNINFIPCSTCAWCLMSTTANATLRASASPAAQSVLFTASKQVRNKPCIHSLPWRGTFMSFIRLLWVVCFQVNAPGTTTSVYENWIKYYNRTSPNGIIPKYTLIIPQYYLMVHKGIIAPWLVK